VTPPAPPFRGTTAGPPSESASRNASNTSPGRRASTTRNGRLTAPSPPQPHRAATRIPPITDHSVLPRERRPVRLALLEERVTTLHRLVGAVRQPCRLPREHLLPDQAVVHRVEGELEHAYRGRRLGQDLLRPLERGRLQLGMRHHCVHGTHLVGALRRVLPREE